MNKRFQDQVAIITGGADGLGLALAGRLAGEGAFVAVFDFVEEKLQHARAALGSAGADFKVDVTDPAAVRPAVEQLIAQRSRVDILVNCAGLTGRTGIKSHEVMLDDFDRVMNVNVRGSFIMFQSVISHMLARNYGRVLHIASISGKEGNAGMLAYSASKAAVIAMAKVQGKEYAETGVTVNALAPAVIRTAMVEALPEAQVKYMTEKIPMKRCGTLDEFAAMAAFIVSPENSFTTGFTFDLTGGRATY
ncbi:MAG TPA: SDR family NAD(P)-dependent oxidoreductase [Verrucomicrobiae bacterium]|jgi:3-oxoacyl-[acyl-carrier protein] reductase